MHNPSSIVEMRDSLATLAAVGFAPLLSVLQDPSCYTNAGRVVLAEVGRRMKLPPKRVRAELQRAREQLQLIEQ